jgi:hypothetical protein
MAVTVEMQNTGDSDLKADVVASIEHLPAVSGVEPIIKCQSTYFSNLQLAMLPRSFRASRK